MNHNHFFFWGSHFVLQWSAFAGTLPALEALDIFTYFPLPIHNITSTNREYQQLSTENQHTTSNKNHCYIFNVLTME
jgi:hypothetical protein